MNDNLHIQNNILSKRLIRKIFNYKINYIMCKIVLCLFIITGLFSVIEIKSMLNFIEISLVTVALIYIFIQVVLNKVIDQIRNEPRIYDLYFDEKYVEAIDNNGEIFQKVELLTFRKIIQTKEEYILFTKTGNFIIIQKANLDVKQKEQFLKLVKELKLIKLSRIN